MMFSLLTMTIMRRTMYCFCNRSIGSMAWLLVLVALVLRIHSNRATDSSSSSIGYRRNQIKNENTTITYPTVNPSAPVTNGTKTLHTTTTPTTMIPTSVPSQSSTSVITIEIITEPPVFDPLKNYSEMTALYIGLYGYGGVYIRNAVSLEQQTISIEITYYGMGYIAFAFTNSSLMIPATAVIGLPTNNTVLKYNMTGYSAADIVPLNDQYQNTLTNTVIKQTPDNSTILSFTIPYSDINVTASPNTKAYTNRFIWAVGSDNSLNKHSFYGSDILQLHYVTSMNHTEKPPFDTSSSPSSPSDILIENPVDSPTVMPTTTIPTTDSPTTEMHMECKFDEYDDGMDLWSNKKIRLRIIISIEKQKMSFQLTYAGDEILFFGITNSRYIYPSILNMGNIRQNELHYYDYGIEFIESALIDNSTANIVLDEPYGTKYSWQTSDGAIVYEFTRDLVRYDSMDTYMWAAMYRDNHGTFITRGPEIVEKLYYCGPTNPPVDVPPVSNPGIVYPEPTTPIGIPKIIYPEPSLSIGIPYTVLPSSMIPTQMEVPNPSVFDPVGIPGIAPPTDNDISIITTRPPTSDPIFPSPNYPALSSVSPTTIMKPSLPDNVIQTPTTNATFPEKLSLYYESDNPSLGKRLYDGLYVKMLTTGDNKYTRIELTHTHYGRNSIGYIGVAVSSPDGTMKGSVAILGSSDYPIPMKWDLYGNTIADVVQVPTNQQTLIDASYINNNTHAVLKFTKLNVEHNEPSILHSQVNTFLYVIGSQLAIGGHGKSRGHFMCNPSIECKVFRNYSKEKSKRNALLAHGIVMLFTWVFIMPFSISVILFRQLFPPGQVWYKIHKISNLFGLLFAVVGFLVVIGIVQQQQDTGNHFRTSSHTKMGLVIIILLLLFQIIIFFNRPTRIASNINSNQVVDDVDNTSTDIKERKDNIEIRGEETVDTDCIVTSSERSENQGTDSEATSSTEENPVGNNFVNITSSQINDRKEMINGKELSCNIDCIVTSSEQSDTHSGRDSESALTIDENRNDDDKNSDKGCLFRIISQLRKNSRRLKVLDKIHQICGIALVVLGWYTCHTGCILYEATYHVSYLMICLYTSIAMWCVIGIQLAFVIVVINCNK